MKKILQLGLIFGSVFTSSIPVAQVTATGYGSCRDGQYVGQQSGRSPFYKEVYTWAVSRGFAKRFCMPEEYIADDLKGAEAIAYRYRPSGAEACDLNDGQPTCGRFSPTHWIEIYVKGDVNIPKYDPEVRFFDNRNTFDSTKMIGTGTIEAVREKYDRNYQARKRGEVLEPPGLRNPYRGFTPAAEGKHTRFHYLARITPSQVEERPAAYSVRYYQQNVYDGLDLIMLEGWGGGNFAGPRYKEPPLGFALGVTTRLVDTEELKYPDGFHHVIEMPKSVMQVMNAIDLAQGQRFEEAMRAAAKRLMPAIPTTPSPLTK
jgi:hypothetical protein